MDIHEYIRLYRKKAAESNFYAEVSDMELAKMFVSHMVISEWQIEDTKKQLRRGQQRASERHWRE